MTPDELGAMAEQCKTALLVAGSYRVDLDCADAPIADRLEAIDAITSLWASDNTVEHVIYEVFPTREGVRQAIDDMHRAHGRCGGICTTALDDIDRQAWALIGVFHAGNDEAS